MLLGSHDVLLSMRLMPSSALLDVLRQLRKLALSTL
jgi:hypothetical protein